jgi:acetyl esterase/lipase
MQRAVPGFRGKHAGCPQLFGCVATRICGLDLYLPEGRTNFPVIVFVHGGAWRIGGRSFYRKVGEHISRAGIGVVIPSYRLAPLYRHPAQIEDVAETFRASIWWGIHRADIWLHCLRAMTGNSRRNIAGGVSMSGVCSINRLEWNFGTTAQARKSASPLLIMYCQWDYITLAGQAKKFHKALTKAGVKSELIRLPGKNHFNEVDAITKGDDRGEKAIVRFVR